MTKELPECENCGREITITPTKKVVSVNGQDIVILKYLCSMCGHRQTEIED